MSRIVDFFEKRITHVKGELAGRPVMLEQWQQDVLNNIFKTREDGLRQYRTVYIEIPRKNSKTTLLAGIALYLLLYDDEPGAEIYSAASDREQAGLMHEVAKGMVQNNPAMKKKCQITRNAIVKTGTLSFYKAISAEAASKHGFNAHGILFDELHAQPNRELWDVLTTSTGSRRQPLTIAITTAGFDKTSICWEIHEYARKVIDGIIQDDSFYGVIYKAEPEDDIYAESTWRKANPGFGTIVKREYIEQQALKIKNQPSFESTFRRLHLNQWVGSEMTWIPDDVWMKCDKGKIFKSEKSSCYGGLDLASVRDIAAFVLYFDDGYIEPYFFIPSDSVVERSKNENINYDQWVKNGYMIATPGNVIDYNFIKAKIIELCGKYTVNKIGFDRWNASQMVIDLLDEGLPMDKYGQGYASMSAPTKELEKRVYANEINHAGNPVLRWMCSNVMLSEDSAGNIKIDKAKSKEKVDGMVATVMALGEKLTDETVPFIYNERGIREI
jgi:phage terminase large subunit-like protein